MKIPAKRRDPMPAPIRLPWGTQVYTHPLPDGRTCRSAWAQHTCSCGVYALTWESKAIAWSGQGFEGEDFIPIENNHGLIEMLAEAIEGPYRFIHEATNIYVGVGPSTPTQPITIRATPRVHLSGDAASIKLKGLTDTMTFVLMMDGSREVLAEVGLKRRPSPSRSLIGPSVAPHTVPLPQSLAVEPSRRKTKLPTLVVAPAPPAPHPVDATIPAIIEAVRKAEDVHPELDDYVVIPMESVPEAEALPRWVVRSPLVDHIRIVKPRLKVDRAFVDVPKDATRHHAVDESR